jgi:uncharacterized protein with von Willebrand factor type A (vWA) domain
MGRHRYGAYREGPDPLGEPFDVARAVDELGDRIMDGSSVRDALRELMQRGADGLRGLDDLRRRIRQRRRSLERSGRMDGLLTDVRELLDTAIEQERRALFPDPSDDARFRESMLDELPEQTGRAVRDLRDYDWRSPEAQATYDEIRKRLASDVLDQQFRGMSQALQSPRSPEDNQRIAAMLGDLNDMLEKHRRGEDVTDDFERFMQQHGEFFPDRPETFEQLLDDLARRAAAMQRMLDSMTPEQRAELMDLMQQAMDDLDIAAQMSRLTDNLRAMRPDLPWQGRQRMSGEQPLGLPDATEALAELADLESLDSQLGQDYPGATLDDIDEDAVRRALGRQALDDVRRLQEIERELTRQGYLTRHGERLDLSPKAIRRIGRTALQRVFASLSTGRRGDHDVHLTGAAGETTGQTRPWTFGDEVPLDVVRTVSNAVRRSMMTAQPVRLTGEDFEVVETEARTRAAVALLVDQSFSMVMNDTWRAAKTTAQRFLDRHHGAEPVVLVVTDGEPTAHLEPDGDYFFGWPPSRGTISRTVAEVDRLTRRGVTISWFRLGDDPRLEEFLDAMARRNGGRVIASSGEHLGDVVVTDYVRSRGARRRSA